MTIHSYQDLTVWQRSIELVETVYELTSHLPKEELFGLSSQMRRSAVSVPSNIAEGRYRGTKNDFVQFLRIAYSSGAELETQVIIAKRLYKSGGINYTQTDALLSELMRMLNRMIKTVSPRD